MVPERVILSHAAPLYLYSFEAVRGEGSLPPCSAHLTSDMKTYYVYIVASKTRALYIGVTNNLLRRVYEHKTKAIEGFTSKYNAHRLVYYEETNDIHAAIAREKQLKGWRRDRKKELINSINPAWKDLSEEWYEKTAG